MKFEELKAIDEYNAFSEFITVAEAKRTGIIPSDYHNIFDDKCDCGSDNIITTGLTRERCCNPRCYIKQGWMLYDMFSKFDCQNIGPATCLDIAEYFCETPKHPARFKNNSYIDLLGMKQSEYPPYLQSVRGDEVYSGVLKILSKKKSLIELLSKLGLPELDSKIETIFCTSENINDFLDRVNDNGGLKKYLESCCIKSSMIAFIIKQFLLDMALAESYCSKAITARAMKRIKVCITGSVYLDGEYMSRDRFLAYINDLSVSNDGTRFYEISLTSSPNVAFKTITDSKSITSRKHKEAVKIGNLITSTDFVKMIKEVVNDYEGFRNQ